MTNQTLIRIGIFFIFFGGLILIIGMLSEIVAESLNVTVRLLHVILWFVIFGGILLIIVGTKSKGKFI